MIAAWLGHTLWQLSSWPEWYRFQRDRTKLRSVQSQLLREALAGLAGVDYGRRWGVQADWDYERFSRQVPLADYEVLQPFLAYPGGLLAEPVRVWEPTGGSTGGSKWIPWTDALQSQFRRAVGVWICDMLRSRPQLKQGRGYWQLTPKTEPHPPEWLHAEAVGFASDGDYLGRAGRLLERLVTVRVPPGNDRFWKKTCLALQRAGDLVMISCWSPSFLLVLEEQMKSHLGCWRPREWWPRLALISCWTQGPSSSMVGSISTLFPGVEMQGKGLLSTEAVTTVPLGDCYPLAYRSHFFEFESEDGEVHPAWSLKDGERYQVVQTTGGGLVRYRSRDWVRVTGFWGEVPCFRFLGREAVSDHFGEKLNEVHLQEVLGSLERFAVLGFEGGGYVLFLEQGENPGVCYGKVNSALLDSFSYRDCIRLGQLRDLRVFILEEAGWHQLAGHLDLRSGRLKPKVFLPQSAWSERLKGKFWNED